MGRKDAAGGMSGAPFAQLSFLWVVGPDGKWYTTLCTNCVHAKRRASE